MLLLAISVLIIGIFLLKNYISIKNRYKEYANKIPGPKPLPIIGSALEFGLSSKSTFHFVQSLTKQYGPVAGGWIGTKFGILLADPDYIELVIGNHKHLKKSSLYDPIGSFIGLGLLINEGEMWRRHRKLIAPTFHGKSLMQFLDIFNSKIDILIEKLLSHANGSEFDIHPLLNLYTLDVICESAMGVNVNAQLQGDSVYVKALTSLEDTAVIRMFRPWLYPDIIFNLTSHGRLQAKCISTIRNVTQRVMKQRRKLISQETHTDETDISNDAEDRAAGLKPKKVFLDHLLGSIDTGNSLSKDELQHEIDTIMIAGHDTTTAGLDYTCWLLARHQDIQEKTLQEMKTIFGDSLRHATMEDLNEMKYLEQVIKESLRLYPPASIFGRQLSEDINAGKYIFPAGCELGINVYMLHRHPDHFPDPERFDPDRFLPENCVNRHPYCYLPFSAGPRNCIGYKYAMLEMKATLSKLLRHFKILPPENPFLELDLTFQFITKSMNGIHLRLEARNFTKRQ